MTNYTQDSSGNIVGFHPDSSEYAELERLRAENLAQQAMIATLQNNAKVTLQHRHKWLQADSMKPDEARCITCGMSASIVNKDADALAAHDAEVRKAALLEAIGRLNSTDSFYGGWARRILRRMAEEGD